MIYLYKKTNLKERKQKLYGIIQKISAQIIIEPFEPAIQKALNKLPEDLKKNIKKVIVHSSGGSGQLGHVEMGPNKDPQEVHIFKNRIQEVVKNMFKNTSPTPAQLEEATESVLMETLVHEGIHIGPDKTPEQISNPNYRFKEELPTQQLTKQKVLPILKQHYPDFAESIVGASLKLDEIKNNLLPNKLMPEPNLKLIAYYNTNRKYDFSKTAIQLIKDEKLHPAKKDIEDAINYNKSSMRNNLIGKILGVLFHIIKDSPLSENGVMKIANYQSENGIEPDGKLTRELYEKLKDYLPLNENLPRNFGVVVPYSLFRGGIIKNEEEIKSLKNLGVKRIISLHTSPNISMLCKKYDIENIIAPIELGKKTEIGRNVLGENVSKILTEVPTYIHCYFGKDRTGGVVARFRTENGWSKEDAYNEAKSFGFLDEFVDLIDWFCECGTGECPVDTSKQPIDDFYKNQELTIALPQIPNDMPYINDNVGLNLYDSSVNINPGLSISPVERV